MEIKEEKVTQTIKTYTFTEDEYHELIYPMRRKTPCFSYGDI